MHFTADMSCIFYHCTFGHLVLKFKVVTERKTRKAKYTCILKFKLHIICSER